MVKDNILEQYLTDWFAVRYFLHSMAQSSVLLQAYIQQELEEREKILANFEPLLPPGQILHVLEKKDNKR